MSDVSILLEAGGLVLPKSKVDAAATEAVVARSYSHPALGNRPVIRLASDRIGPAEDLAMEFLGFQEPDVSDPVGIQQRQSLGFAAWALINDSKNARFALDLVKRMKKAARQAKSKPGHAWDAYTEMANELGRSVRHFLPPFWEEAGRAYKDLGNQTYAGRALNKSLEAERVHAIDSDRARRRDVVLEFVLAGCLAGNALSDYGNDLQTQYAPEEAFAIFRDLCVRRTRGGMSPWSSLPKEFLKFAKTAGLDADAELEKWLEEIIEAPAMARPPLQFWKTCGPHCKRIVARNPGFAVALLRHTKPAPRYYGESQTGPWLDLLESWGVFEFIWNGEFRGAPPLGEPIATWFSRIVRETVPVPNRILDMLEKVASRLRKEAVPLSFVTTAHYRYQRIDIDVLETCHAMGVTIEGPIEGVEITFDGWLTANPDHPRRNQDIVESWKDERYQTAVYRGFAEALKCRGTPANQGYGRSELARRSFPLAANNRPGITTLWRRHMAELVKSFENAGLASFESSCSVLSESLWPEAIKIFPDLAAQLNQIDPITTLQQTLQSGIFDEYGWPALEELIDRTGVEIHNNYSRNTIFVVFPYLVLIDDIHAYVVQGQNEVKKYELRLPRKSIVTSIVPVGDDLAVCYRNDNYQGYFFWINNRERVYETNGYGFYRSGTDHSVTKSSDGGVFTGVHAVRPGDSKPPEFQPYLHDGQRFWRCSHEFVQSLREHRWKIREVDPQTGKEIRESVPPWFEETDRGSVEWASAQLMTVPPGTEDSPLGTKNGLIGWKSIKGRNGRYHGEGIDGRSWEPSSANDVGELFGLLRQPETECFLPVTHSHNSRGMSGGYKLWNSTGTTVIAELQTFNTAFARGQVTCLPIKFWHFLKLRDKATSKKIREISHKDCESLINKSLADRPDPKNPRAAGNPTTPEQISPHLNAEIKKQFPTAPPRLVRGIETIVQRAQREIGVFLTQREKLNQESKQETKKTSSVANSQRDLAADQWKLPRYNIFGSETPISLTSHLLVVSKFLKGETTPGELPRTNINWLPMLERLSIRCWKTYWRVQSQKMSQKDSGAIPWLEFLEFWCDLGITKLPGRFDILEGRIDYGTNNLNTSIENKFGSGHSVRQGNDSFVVLRNETYGPHSHPNIVLRYSTDQSPGYPAGFEIADSRKIEPKFDTDEISNFVELVKTATALPLPKKNEFAELADRLSVSPAEIALIWLGGLNFDSYQSNFLPSELRQALGYKTTDISAAKQALNNLNATVRESLYEAVVATGLTVPFSDDRASALRAIESVWLEKMPKRLPLDADLQKRLSALEASSRWNHTSHEELLVLAADPTKHPVLQPKKMELIHDKEQRWAPLRIQGTNASERIITADMLGCIIRLVALVYSETPSGHAARSSLPALIKQTSKLINDSKTLLELRSFHFYTAGTKKLPTPSEWLGQHLGKTEASVNDAPVRYKDELFEAAAVDVLMYANIGFRPAALNDDSNIARLLGVNRLEIGEESMRNRSISTVAVIRSPGFQKMVTAIASKDVLKDHWPQNPNHTASDTLKQIEKKRKIGTDAAMLYMQVLALPEPTASNVCVWNGWTTAQYKKASAELTEHKLVLEATRARAGRSIFLPGEWLDLKAPWLPIERWKLTHLFDMEIDIGDLLPAAGPMVLRPFEDLYTAAWQRILDGDEPRYEEVQQVAKKRTKKK